MFQQQLPKIDRETSIANGPYIYTFRAMVIYEEAIDESILSEEYKDALKANRKKEKKVLYFIYQAIDEANIFERVSMAASGRRLGILFVFLHTKTKKRK